MRLTNFFIYKFLLFIFFILWTFNILGTPKYHNNPDINKESLSEGYDDVGNELYIGAGISIVGGGILMTKGCPCCCSPPNAGCILKCVAGAASVVGGGYMIGSARKQKKTARQLRDQGTNFNYCDETPAPPGCPGYVQAQYCDQDPIPPGCPGHTTEEYCDRTPTPPGCPGFTATEYCDQVPKPSGCNDNGKDIGLPEIPELPEFPDGFCDIDPKPPGCPGSIPLPEMCQQFNMSCNFDGDDLTGIKMPNLPEIKAPFDKNAFANAGIGEDEFNKALQDFQKDQSKIVGQAKNLVNKKLKLNNGAGDGDADSSASDFEPTLSSGGGSGRGRSFSDNNGDGSDASYLDMLKNSLNANKNKAKGRKIQSFKPLTFGNDKIGTAYDNIFEQVSKSYNSMSSSNRTLP